MASGFSTRRLKAARSSPPSARSTTRWSQERVAETRPTKATPPSAVSTGVSLDRADRQHRRLRRIDGREDFGDAAAVESEKSSCLPDDRAAAGRGSARDERLHFVRDGRDGFLSAATMTGVTSPSARRRRRRYRNARIRRMPSADQMAFARGTACKSERQRLDQEVVDRELVGRLPPSPGFGAAAVDLLAEADQRGRCRHGRTDGNAGPWLRPASRTAAVRRCRRAARPCADGRDGRRR